MDDTHTNTISLRDSAVVALDIIGPFVAILFSNGETVTLETSVLKQLAIENAIDDFGRAQES